MVDGADCAPASKKSSADAGGGGGGRERGCGGGEMSVLIYQSRFLVSVHNHVYAPTRVIVSSSGISRYQRIWSRISLGSVERAEILPAASRAIVASALIATDARNVLLGNGVSRRKHSGDSDRYRLE